MESIPSHPRRAAAQAAVIWIILIKIHLCLLGRNECFLFQTVQLSKIKHCQQQIIGPKCFILRSCKK